MKRVLMIGAATGLMAVVATTQVFGQDASLDEAPMPYAEYVAALEELQVASRAVFLRLGSAPATAEVVAAYQEVIPLGQTDLRRLSGVVPEPCYATAHQEVLAYRGSVIEITEQALPQMAESETLANLTAILEVLDAGLRTRHPSAYLEGRDASAGFGGSYRNILAALTACDTDAIAQATDGTSEPDQRVVVDGSYSVTVPGGWLHELEDPDADEDRLRRALGYAPNLWLGDPTGAERCRIEYGPNDDATLESIDAEGRQHPEFDLDYVDLPAGRALRIVGPIEEAGGEHELVFYAMIQRSTRVQIQCAAPTARDDGWLPIAESFQFLPEETEDGTPDRSTSPGPGMSGRRQEVPDAGVAVHLPEGWVSLPPAMAGDAAVVAVFVSPTGDGTCGIARYPSASGDPAELGVEEFVSAGYWTELPGGYAADRVELAGGDAVKITYTEASIDTDVEYWNAIYVIPAEEDLYTVQCTTDDPGRRPADDWLAIAETFEVLAADEE